VQATSRNPGFVRPGLTQAAMFTVLAVIMVLLIPLVFLVPEHRGTS